MCMSMYASCKCNPRFQTSTASILIEFSTKHYAGRSHVPANTITFEIHKGATTHRRLYLNSMSF